MRMDRRNGGDERQSHVTVGRVLLYGVGYQLIEKIDMFSAEGRVGLRQRSKEDFEHLMAFDAIAAAFDVFGQPRQRHR